MKSAQKKPPYKIGFVFDDTLDSYDGVSQYVKTLGRWFSEQGHEVRYLVGETKLQEWAGGKVYSLSKNQKVTFNGNQVHIPLPANKGRIKKVLKDEEFDILHVQVPYSPFMAQKVINSADKNTVIFGTFHILPSGPLSSFGSHALKFMYGFSLRKFAEVVSVSAPAASFAKKAYGISSDVLPNAVDIKNFSSADKISENVNERIVFLGRLVKRKGCEELIKAFSILHSARPQARLVIAGKGPDRTKLERLVRKLNLDDIVDFFGFIDEKEKPALLASANIACFPSLGGESFGIVLIEAMAAGSGVVIGGNNAGYNSVLGLKADLLINPKDHKKFAQTLEKFLKNKKLAAGIHNWQKQEVKSYDVAVVGNELLRRYAKLIAK
jgi:phosphatidylinositol alpha-mannosyltransferase